MKKAFLLIFVLLIMPAVSYGITIGDNTLTDWGVNPGNGWWVPGVSQPQNGKVDTPLTGVSQGISYWVENGNNHGYVGPGFGTECDIKAMYAKVESNTLYFAIALGDSVLGDTKYDKWGIGYIGDIGFSLNSGATYAYGIATEKRPEETYNTAHSLTPGNLYSVSSWTDVDPSYPTHLTSAPVRIDQYTQNLGAINYSFDKYLDFYLMEGAIPLDLLNGDVNMIHLTQTCGNDVGNLPVDPVPEPSTLLFLGMGLLGLAGMGRRWIKKK